MPHSELLKDYPWAISPVLINAPMAGFAGFALATAVTQAGGIGMVGIVNDMVALEKNLENASTAFSKTSTMTSPSSLSTTPEAFYQETHLLPLGVGLLLFATTLEAVLPVLQRHPPAFVWLFAAHSLPDDYRAWARALRAALPRTRIWVQVGSAGAAAQVARAEGDSDGTPDVLVLQGSDAGGHGFKQGAGIVSLVPEVRSLLSTATISTTTTTSLTKDKAARRPAIVAAGGLVNGQGVAAALALGVDGVVLGTRFLAATEADVPPAYRAAVLAARDGASGTVRSTVFDELRGPSVWPASYDGRALATDTYADWRDGLSIDIIRDRYREAATAEDKGYGSRAAVWAGAGVGLVNEIEPAAAIVQSIRDDAKRALTEALSVF